MNGMDSIAYERERDGTKERAYTRNGPLRKRLRRITVKLRHGLLKATVNQVRKLPSLAACKFPDFEVLVS